MYHKPCADSNYFHNSTRKRDNIEYIVVHYTGNNGDTARNNVDYFARTKVGASAHYFVDGAEVACSVPWYKIAWHCGGSKGSRGSSVHAKCRNSNSIGVELCCKKDKSGAFYFDDNTVSNAAAFIASLMRDYHVPIERVVRHYDVTGKICPAPFIDEKAWAAFKNLIMRKFDGGTYEVDVKYYEKLEEIPAGEFRETVRELVNKKVIRGKADGLHLSEDMLRCLVFCRRMVENR